MQNLANGMEGVKGAFHTLTVTIFTNNMYETVHKCKTLPWGTESQRRASMGLGGNSSPFQWSNSKLMLGFSTLRMGVKIRDKATSRRVLPAKIRN